MDVLTSETCWAWNNEIKKQVTSSWSIFIQILACLCWAVHVVVVVAGWCIIWPTEGLGTTKMLTSNQDNYPQHVNICVYWGFQWFNHATCRDVGFTDTTAGVIRSPERMSHEITVPFPILSALCVIFLNIDIRTFKIDHIRYSIFLSASVRTSQRTQSHFYNRFFGLSSYVIFSIQAGRRKPVGVRY